jgi:hypothetical protein
MNLNAIKKDDATGPSKAVAPDAVRAVVGKNDWLFLCHDSNQLMDQLQGRMKVPEERLPLYRNAFIERRKQFEDFGIPYIFAIAPTKELIYGDALPEGYEIDHSAYPANAIRTIAEEAGLDVLCLRGVLAEAKTREDVYFRTDTHWNDAGSYAVSEALIERCRKYFPELSIESFESLHSQRVHAGFRGDLANKLKMRYDATFNSLVEYDPPLKPARFTEYPVAYTSKNASALQDGPIDDYLQVSTTRESVVKISQLDNKPHVLVFRDSFMSEAIKYFSSSFSRAVYLWTPDIDFDVILREKPDLVVHVVADRFLVRVPRNKGLAR